MDTVITLSLTNTFALIGLVLPAFVSIGMLYQRSRSHGEEIKSLWAHHDDMLRDIRANTTAVNNTLLKLQTSVAVCQSDVKNKP